jgi:hypothetical protein
MVGNRFGCCSGTDSDGSWNVHNPPLWAPPRNEAVHFGIVWQLMWLIRILFTMPAACMQLSSPRMCCCSLAGDQCLCSVTSG